MSTPECVRPDCERLREDRDRLLAALRNAHRDLEWAVATIENAIPTMRDEDEEETEEVELELVEIRVTIRDACAAIGGQR